MKNPERQRSLDKKKYLESIRLDSDQNGKMIYCQVCNYKSIFGDCIKSQAEKDQYHYCATAYNRMKRKKHCTK